MDKQKESKLLSDECFLINCAGTEQTFHVQIPRLFMNIKSHLSANVLQQNSCCSSNVNRNKNSLLPKYTMSNQDIVMHTTICSLFMPCSAVYYFSSSRSYNKSYFFPTVTIYGWWIRAWHVSVGNINKITVGTRSLVVSLTCRTFEPVEEFILTNSCSMGRFRQLYI